MVNPRFEIALATLFWGFGAVLVRWMDLPPTSVSFFRLVVPAVIAYVYLSRTSVPLFTKHPKTMVLVSVMNAVRLFIFWWGFSLTTIGNAWLIAYTWPLFMAILSANYLGETISKKDVFFLCTAFFGIIIIFLGQEFSLANDDFVGMLLVLGEAIMYATIITIFKKRESSFSNWEMLFYFNFIGPFIFLPFMFLHPLPTLMQTGLGLTLGTTTGIIGFVLFFAALKKLRASEASTMTFLEVVFAMLFGVIFFGEAVTWNILVGGALIVASVYFLKKDPQPID